MGNDARTGLVSHVVTQIRLADDQPVINSRQEGGKGLLSGTFRSVGTTVVIDVDVSALFLGWGAAGVDLHIGIVETATDPWEPGGKNVIVKADFEGRTPLRGVRDYRHFQIGMLDANAITPQISRKIMLDDLDPDTTYHWELRTGCASFFKHCKFEPGSCPTSVTVTPDGLYAWATLEGGNKLALVQLGWSALWEKYGYSPEMITIAEIELTGTPGGVAPQPRPRPGPPSLVPNAPDPGRNVAVVDQGSDELVLIDNEALAIDGRFGLPDGAVPSPHRVIWDRFGDALYVGGSDGRLHRFDPATRTFDAAIDVDLTEDAAIIPLGLQTPPDDPAAEATHVWCSSHRGGKIVRIALADRMVEVVHDYGPNVAAPTCGVVRQQTGGIVVVEDEAKRVRYIDMSGASISDWGSSMKTRDESPAGKYSMTEAVIPDRPPSGRRWSSVCIDDEEVRAFWTHDGIFGWAWIDGAHDPDPENGREDRVINKGTLDILYKTEIYGDIAATRDEGTLLAVPDEDVLIQWPGGELHLRPGEDAPGSWGTERCTVTFTGAEASGG